LSPLAIAPRSEGTAARSGDSVGNTRPAGSSCPTSSSPSPETTAGIHPLTTQVLEMALGQARAWLDRGWSIPVRGQHLRRIPSRRRLRRPGETTTRFDRRPRPPPEPGTHRRRRHDRSRPSHVEDGCGPIVTPPQSFRGAAPEVAGRPFGQVGWKAMAELRPLLGCAVSPGGEPPIRRSVRWTLYPPDECPHPRIHEHPPRCALSPRPGSIVMQIVMGCATAGCDGRLPFDARRRTAEGVLRSRCDRCLTAFTLLGGTLRKDTAPTRVARHRRSLQRRSSWHGQRVPSAQSRTV